MALPYFYVENLHEGELVLDEDSSRHIVSVLRMQKQEVILLTDGKGRKSRAHITEDHRKHCKVHVDDIVTSVRSSGGARIGISLVKNASRFEWFLEKATEIGVAAIYPLLCARTEKEKFRHDRLRSIMVSAMLQSQQSWMPQLTEPVLFEEILGMNFANRYIAHCEDDQQKTLPSVNPQTDSIILIGPEGDFTPDEIDTAREAGYRPVSLGATRLRTETAGVVAATLLCVR